ncbi:hypothetical protein SLA2020_528110 [Shorea laevis]
MGVDMMRHMVYYRLRSTLALVYETLITLLMVNVGVDLSGAKPQDLSSHESLNDTSLKMGYVFKPRLNAWGVKQKKEGGQDDEGEGDDEAKNEEENEEAGPSQAGSSRVPQKISTNKGILLILERLAQLDKKLKDHIQECQSIAPPAPSATISDPTAAGTSSEPMPTELSIYPET